MSVPRVNNDCFAAVLREEQLNHINISTKKGHVAYQIEENFKEIARKKVLPRDPRGGDIAPWQ